MANWFRRKRDPSVPAEPISQEELPHAEEIESSATLTAEPEPAQEVLPVQEELMQEKIQSVWRRGLARLRRALTTPLGQMFRGRPFSEEIFDELEEALLAADVGVQTTTTLIERTVPPGKTQRSECSPKLPERRDARVTAKAT